MSIRAQFTRTAVCVAVLTPCAAAATLPGAAVIDAAPRAGAPGAVGVLPEGWTTEGRGPASSVTLPDGAAAVRLADNTTLVSPELDVPGDAQVLMLRARSSGRSVVTVTARPADGSAAVLLGLVVPDRAATARPVAIAAVAGRRVRLVFDPSTPLGGAVDVGDVGPFAAPLPGWRVLAGAPYGDPLSPGASLWVRDDPVRLEGPEVTPPPDVRRLLVSASGGGTLSLDAGAGRVRVDLTKGWRDVWVPVNGGVPVRLGMRVVPGEGVVRLRDLGAYVFAVRVRLTGAVRARGRVTLHGTLGPEGAGLAVRVTGRGGRPVARTRAAADGVFALRLGRRARGLRVRVVGDRTRLPVTVPVPGELLSAAGPRRAVSR